MSLKTINHNIKAHHKQEQKKKNCHREDKKNVEPFRTQNSVGFNYIMEEQRNREQHAYRENTFSQIVRSYCVILD